MIETLLHPGMCIRAREDDLSCIDSETDPEGFIDLCQDEQKTISISDEALRYGTPVESFSGPIKTLRLKYSAHFESSSTIHSVKLRILPAAC